MIHESHYWKEPLIRAAKSLKKIRVNNRNAERVLFQTEKHMFLGFYAIRKLLETMKISTSTKSVMFDLQWSPNIKTVDYLNFHRIDELFDLNIKNIEARNIEFICNQFIHSYIFIPVEGDSGKLDGFYVASDRARHERIYFLSLHQVVSIFNLIGNDYPSSSHKVRDQKTGQWVAVDIS